MDLSKKLDIEVEGIQNQDLENEIRSGFASPKAPAGDFGHLQDVALRIGLVLQTSKPTLSKASVLIFAGDHGIVEEGVSVRPPNFTHDKVLEFLNGGAVVNHFAKRSELNFKVIDIGVKHSFEGTLTYWLHHGSRFFNRKVGYGTRNFMEYPAMTTAQAEKALQVGVDMVDRELAQGGNIIGLSDIGTGNTTSAAVLCAALEDAAPDTFLIAGSSSKAEELEHKRQKVEKALRKHPKTHDPQTILTLFGGFEVAALAGAVLRAAENKMVILIDGFVSAAAVLVASAIKPEVRDYCIFCSGSEEPGHRALLKALDAKPLLQLDIRTGEGTAIALAYPLILNAVDMMMMNASGS